MLKKSKVLFVNPARSGQGTVPLNIPILIAALREHKHEVFLFNFSDYAIFDVGVKQYEQLFFKDAPLDTVKIINDRQNFYKNAGEFFDGCELKKSDIKSDFERLIKKFNPDIIAVTSLSLDYEYVVNFLRPFKKKYRIPIIFGGIHTILLPEEVIHSEICDYICTGEGEKCLISLLNCLDNNGNLSDVNGIWYKQGGVIYKNNRIQLTDIKKISAPDFDDFDPIHFYRPFDGKRYKMLNYEFSRGCPFNCSYCVNGVLKEKYRGLGTYHRIKTTEQSIEEIKILVKKYDFNFIRFWDEDFTSVSLKKLNEFATSYIDKIGLPFLIYARVTTVNENKVRILKDMGCKSFAMAIESGNEFIREKVLNRKMSNQEIIEKFNLVKSYGIRVSSYNMIGLPLETRESIFDTIELNRLVNPDSLSVTLLEPYKGTPIRKMCEEQGLDPKHEITWDIPQFIPKGMTFEELKGLRRTFPLYIRLPKERWDEIRKAEYDDNVFWKIFEDFNLKFKN